MTPTEDDGSKRRGLAPVTRKKRLPEALSWRLCPPAPSPVWRGGGEGEKPQGFWWVAPSGAPPFRTGEGAGG
jgi:hypothetical protein